MFKMRDLINSRVTESNRWIEVCAGREGDDVHFKLPIDTFANYQLMEALSTGAWMFEDYGTRGADPFYELEDFEHYEGIWK